MTRTSLPGAAAAIAAAFSCAAPLAAGNRVRVFPGERKGLVYDRNLSSGFGDRALCYLCAAAVGAAVDADVYTSWAVQGHVYNFDKGLRRNYHWATLQQSFAWPKNLHFVPEDELRRLPYEQLNHTGAMVAAVDGYDQVPPICLYTYSLPEAGGITGSDFIASYRKVAAGTGPSLLQTVKGQRIVLHIRGDDMKPSPAEFKAMVGKLRSALDLLRMRMPAAGVEVVTDDNGLEGEVLTSLGLVGKVQAAGNVSAVEGHEAKTREAVLDMNKMMQSCAILQFARRGWSSFSLLPALMQEVPLVSISANESLVAGLDSVGERPEYLCTMDELDQCVDLAAQRCGKAGKAQA